MFRTTHGEDHLSMKFTGSLINFMKAPENYTAEMLGCKGAPGGTRTPNLLIRSQVLYPLSYGRIMPTGKSTG
jgi:hypothetical protein